MWEVVDMTLVLAVLRFYILGRSIPQPSSGRAGLGPQRGPQLCTVEVSQRRAANRVLGSLYFGHPIFEMALKNWCFGSAKAISNDSLVMQIEHRHARTRNLRQV